MNHPPDYVAHPSGIQTIQISGRENIFLRTAVDYLWRGGLRADRIEDLKKARWYIDREIERLEKSE